jgi:hypothetical protein
VESRASRRFAAHELLKSDISRFVKMGISAALWIRNMEAEIERCYPAPTAAPLSNIVLPRPGPSVRQRTHSGVFPAIFQPSGRGVCIITRDCAVLTIIDHDRQSSLLSVNALIRKLFNRAAML